MTVRELYEHFLSKNRQVDPDDTPDGIEVGPADKEPRKIGIGWMACAPNLRAAAADGCGLFITHEPAFCEYWEPGRRFRDSDWGRQRERICRENNMALLAIHDCWDVFPTWGIRDSWAAFLGLTEDTLLTRLPYRDEPEFIGIYEVPATTVGDYAQLVATKIEPFGEHAVFVMGDVDAPVRKVATGVGCAIPEFTTLAAGPDVMITVFDRAFQTLSRVPLAELGANLIVVEHGVTEMPGMQNMARYLTETFPDLSAAYYRNEPDCHVVLPRPVSKLA